MDCAIILRVMTRMQLVRTLAAWRPDLTAYRDVEAAYRISLKSLARRYLELHDEIADLDAMIGAIVDELAPDLVARNSIGHVGAAQLLLTAGDNPERLRSEASFAALCGVSPVPASSGKDHPASPQQRRRSRMPTAPCTSSPSAGLRTDPENQGPTSPDASPKGIRSSKPFAPSSATSPARSSPSSCSATRRSIRPSIAA